MRKPYEKTHATHINNQLVKSLMITETYLGILAGVLVRTIIPYLVKLKKNPELKWDNKYLISAAAGLILSVITAVLLANNIKTELGFVAAFCTAFTLHSLSRETQKALGY